MPLQPGSPAFNKKRTPPPDETFEEAAYLKALGEKQRVVSLKLADGDGARDARGWSESVHLQARDRVYRRRREEEVALDQFPVLSSQH
jgi:hypothetical protein